MLVTRLSTSVAARAPFVTRLVLVLATIAAVVWSLGAVDVGGGTAAVRVRPQSEGRAALSKHMYWGAWIAGRALGGEAPWSMRALSNFARHAGKAPSVVNFSAPFVDCRSRSCVQPSFPEEAFNAVRGYGAIPFFSWGSDALPFSVNQPNLSLGSIINGRWDGYIRSWADAAKSWSHPFFLRFDWEMNGTWFPWAEGVNGNTAGQYVQAWRHVHDIFRSVGATNVTWVWCPNADTTRSRTPMAGFYPGDTYVDWTCLDGYNRGRPWRTFQQIFGLSYASLTTTIAPAKPVAIGETASTERGGSKAAWITDLLSTDLPTLFPQIKAFLWFDKGDSAHGWPIESSAAAVSAFASAIASPTYAPNQFGTLGGGPIAPLP